MTSPAHPDGRAFVFGANHRSSGLSLRDHLFVDDRQLPKFLSRLAEAGIDNALMLSTCDRVEVQGFHPAPEQIVETLYGVYSDHSQIEVEALSDKFYLHCDSRAIRHLCGVASSLDSLVVGEPQVLGQLKAAHRAARDLGMIRGPFETLLQHAYHTAKRVRTETKIGERPVSIASAACEIAKGVHGDLSNSYVALLGAGEMGELIARQFRDTGVAGVTVLHPHRSRAEPLASRLECHLAEFDDMHSILAMADTIVCAMGRRVHSLTTDHVRSALKTRKNRPQFIIDATIPGDVEPSVNLIDDAFVYDLSDLERAAMEGQKYRQNELGVASAIVDEEVARYLIENEARNADELILFLRENANQIRNKVLSEHANDASRATELLISKLFHEPSAVLRQKAVENTDQFAQAEVLLRELFNHTQENNPIKNPKENKQ